jgi:hypothetical protein
VILSTRRDRERWSRLEERRERYRALAAGARDHRERRNYERLARRLDRQVKLARTFPPSIWLFFAALAPLLVWALLKRAGHGTVGVLAALALGAVEAAIRNRRRRGSQ